MPTDVEKWKDDIYGAEIKDHMRRFAEEGWEAIPEDEHDEWFERFKWWGLYHQRDGQEGYFMMRIGPPDGILEPGQLRVIGEIARDFATGPAENPEFGNGYADVTTRQAVQLHWITIEDVPEIWDRLEEADLSTQQACGDSWRNIVGCPVAGKDKREFVDAVPVIKDLNENFKGNPEYENLPRKWKVSVAGCREGCGQGDINDVGIEPAQKEIDGETVRGFNIRVGGGLAGREARFARDIDVFAEPDEVVPVLGGLSGLFRDYGNRDNRRRARIKFLVDEWGPEKVRETLQEEYVDFYLKTAGEDLREEYSYNAGVPDDHGHADHVGVHEQPDGDYYVGLNVLVGRVDAEKMIELADIAEKYGSGEARLSQRQNIILTDIAEENLDSLLDEPVLEQYSPDPHPFQRGSIACTGTEFCSLSIVETKNRQVRFSRWLKQNVELPEDVANFHIHLSGCTASCAQPQIADISLRGMKTRKDGETVEALDIGVGGGLGKDPSFATWIQERIAADEVPGAIRNLVDGFAARREDGQTFREFVNTLHAEELETLASPEETSYEDPYMHNTKKTWYPYAEDDDMDASPAPNSPSESVSGDD